MSEQDAREQEPELISQTSIDRLNELKAMRFKPEGEPMTAPSLADQLAALMKAMRRGGANYWTDELEALVHGVQPVSASWQPIETAPKDGTNVLLFDGKAVGYGGWMSAEDQGAEPEEAHLIAVGWWSVDLSDNSPTHWMPLPPAPLSLSSQEQE
jgi:hypothetical protein